jgi:hypothetical protein
LSLCVLYYLGIFPSECVEVLQGEPDKLVLKSVEEDETESAVEQQPTDADSFVPLALLLVPSLTHARSLACLAYSRSRVARRSRRRR